MVAEILPPSLMGDYHLAGTRSPAYGRGAASTTVPWGLRAGATPSPRPPTDIDGDRRPSHTATRYDAGSDQLTP